VDGVYTRYENIADNNGIRMAYEAWKEALNREDIKGSYFSPPDPSAATLNKDLNNNDDYTYFASLYKFTREQVFFISYAQLWCGVDTVQNERIASRMDDHAYRNARVIGPLQNLEAFSQAFKCPLFSPMNPAQKCIIWE
jgi:predicted metalloendopeptidase